MNYTQPLTPTTTKVNPINADLLQYGRTIRLGGKSYDIQHTWDTYMINGKIRRLTPRECERLMGWPDDWTRWGINDKGEKVEMSDSQRYKMCGNGVVSNVVREVFSVIPQHNSFPQSH